MIERERSFDLSKLKIEEAEKLAEQIGQKVRGLVDEAADKINLFLKIYGMSAKLQVVIDEKDKPKKSNSKKKPSKSRK